MKAAPFEYVRPLTVDEAVTALVDAGGDGKAIAGGQSLVPLMAMRLARPSVLVDLNGIDGLDGIGVHSAGTVRVGAMCRHRDLAEQDAHPLLAAASRWIGHRAIRTRGTLGGSLAHADPNAELPAVAVAVDAVVSTHGPGGGRDVPAGELFESVFETSLGDDEVVTAVDLAVPRRWGFDELARRHGDFGLVLAAVAELEAGWRVVVGGVGSVPHRAVEAERLLDDGADVPDGVDRVAAAVAASVSPFGDVHATAGYRRAMAGHVAGRAVARALDPRRTGRSTWTSS